MSDARRNPGPIWMWFTAWSMQGAGAFLVDRGEFDDPWMRLALLGAVAAIPLAVLYFALSRRSA